MVDYIKIPKDFKSLHELKELVNNYGLVRRLLAALNDYQRMYVNSFLMNLDEVLAYIPESQHSEYTIKLRNNYISKYNNVTFEKLSISKALLSIDVEKTEKIFLVDTVNKTVDACFWATEKNHSWTDNDTLLDKTKYRPDVKYLGGASYRVDEESELIYVSATYSFESHRIVGGVVINRGSRNSYMSGGKREKFLDFGKDVYVFCTRTNKYLGYKK